MKKLFIRLLRVAGVIAVLGIGTVIALDQYYQCVFPMLVTINGVYCTGMTVGNAAKVLNDSYDLHSDRITVRMLDGSDHELPLDEYGVTISYEPAVTECMKQCKARPFQWLGASLNEKTVYPTYYCDTAVMAAKLEDTEWLGGEPARDGNTVSIVRSAAAGYILVDETRNLLSREAAVELICGKILNHLSDMSGAPFQSLFIDLPTGAD